MSSRYQTIRVNKYNQTGSLYYQTNVYPTIEPADTDYYVITTINDRLDLIALDFYQDQSLWWIIASANALPGDSLYPPVGMQLRIPMDINTVLNNYIAVNNGY